MAPPNGEQRCHGSCNVGQQPTVQAIQDWSVVARPSAHCDVSHHRPPSRAFVPIGPSLATFYDVMLSHVPVLRENSDNLEGAFIDLDETTRIQYQANATPWELQHSRLLTLSGYTPIVDDVNTVLAYARSYKSTGVYQFVIYSVDGDRLWSTTTGEDPVESDVLGNELLAAIVTLGGSLIVKSMARGVMAAVASRAEGLLTKVVLTAAKGLSEEGQSAVLLALRSMRARALVKAFTRRGAKVIVNIGGEAGPEEVAQFGEQIALNHAVRFGAAKRFVPNLIKEPGENIGRVFEPGTIDKIVSRKLDAAFDVEQVATGSYKALKSSGELSMQIHTHNPEFLNSFVQALKGAGFKDVKTLGNVVLATKP